MKCDKCGNKINKSDKFCSYCDERVVNNEKDIVKNDQKTKKKLFTIFAIEIILSVLVVLGYSSYFDKKYATQDEFRNLVQSKNYTVEDVKNTDVKVYDLATTNGKNLGLHYIIGYNNSNASKVFNSLYYQINSQKKNGSISTVTFDLMNYNYYSLENGGSYFVVVKNGNTIFAATGSSQYKNEIKAMVEELGFGYPSNILYVIIAIAIVIFILTIVVMWKIFVKAGIKGWKSLIPFYNYYCLSKIAFNKGWLFILLLITPINIVFMLILSYKLAKRFGKSTAFAVCSILFPYITMQIIAFDNSKYISYEKEK